MNMTTRSTDMHVAGLWRYPIKSLGGEPLDHAELTGDGIAGDRIVHVRSPAGPLTGRVRHGLLTLPVTTGPDGTPHVDGHSWQSPEAQAMVGAVGGPDATMAAYDGPERFDILNLLVATDGAVAQFGHDIRRLRPNILIGGVPGLAETSWPGHALAIGDTVIGLHSLRGRCVVTSIDPDTGARDPGIFRHIRTDFNGELALNSWVIREGTISIGQPARLIETTAQPTHIGGWIVGAPYEH